MNKTITTLLLLFCAVTKLSAQQDTIYYDADWKIAKKADAEFYRPIPLKKLGVLYEVRDYYINGKLQMEGYYTNAKDEKFEGITKWYYENGQLSQEKKYNNNVLNGEALSYTKEGYLRAKGTYKNNKYWTGTFKDECCLKGYSSAYKEGKWIGKIKHYTNSNQIAINNFVKNDSTTITSYFDRKGKNIGDLTTKRHYFKDGLFINFYEDTNLDVINIQDYQHYKNDYKNGEQAVFNKEGKQISKGVYKNNEPYSGTIYKYEIVSTYVAGALEGPVIGYSSEMKPVSKGIYKANKRWNGEFKSVNGNTITNFKNGKIEGKQTTYFTNNFEQIQSYHTILNDSKEGESVVYDKEGKELVKGVYKDNKPYDGTFLIEGFLETKRESYKQGIKHGMFITYDNLGEIEHQLEYKDGELTGNITSRGYVDDEICNCIYKKGKPYNGKVCQAYSREDYENGILIKEDTYDRDYETEKYFLIKTITYTNQGDIKAKTIIYEGKNYTLTFKNEKPYNGIHHSENDIEFVTYKNGKKEGAFSSYENYFNQNLIISGNFKNNLWDGKVFFDEKKLDKATNCTYKKGNPINGTVIKGTVFTSYRKGLKHGLEKKLKSNNTKQQVERVTEYNEGNILNTTWPNEDKEKIITGTFKNNKPYNGDFLTFKDALGSFTHYKEGIITGTRYQGYNDYENLITTDSLVYKNGKPYQGKLLEHPEGDRFHIHNYEKGKLTETSITRDNLKREIRNTVTYSDTGFIIYEETDAFGAEAKYLNKEKTKVKIVYTHENFSGFVEYFNNSITAIDINYKQGSKKIKYALIDNKLLVTLNEGNFLKKAYPKVTEISYKSFLDLEHLFMDEEVFIETYIDNKKVAEGIMKNNDYSDGVHIFYYKGDNTYRYYNINKGEKNLRKGNLTKEELLKQLKE